MISDEEVREALAANADRGEGDTWAFHGSGVVHDEVSALAITRACLLLDAPVTDCLTAGAWLDLVERVVAIEEATRRLGE